MPGIRASTSTTAATSEVLADPTEFPLWCSLLEPGSTHDITAAREHSLGALCPMAAAGLPTLADKDCQGAGIGVHHHPIKGHDLGVDHRACNGLLTGMRAIGERAIALVNQRWTTLRRVTLSHSKIGATVTAALVLTTFKRGCR